MDSISPTRVLLVEDDPAHALLMREVLSDLGDEIEHAASRADALHSLEAGRFDLVVLDVALPDGSGFAIQKWLGERNDATPVVFVTSDDTTEHAVDALRAGAVHYVVKRPNYLDRMRAAAAEVIRHSSRADGPAAGDGRPADAVLIGESPAMGSLRGLVRRYAAVSSPVLVVGETGTGKELVARTLHDLGPRGARPFVAVNCASIAEQLFESEVFGAARGSYTGALRDREGLVGEADGGTLFLDEVSELSLGDQAKLLRLLENGTYRRIGESRERSADLRIIAATNRDLRQAVAARAFREDLFYRLGVLVVPVPPLRERKADIPRLVDFFLSRSHGARAPRLAPQAQDQLMAHDWPGNVRELKHALERATVLADRGEIRGFDLTGDEAAPGPGPSDSERILGSLRRHRGHLESVAIELGVSERTVQRRMRKLGVRSQDFRESS